MWVSVADKLWGLDTWMWGLWWDLNIDVEACMLQRVNVGCVWLDVWTSVFRCVCGRVCSGEGVQVGVWDRGRACVGGIGMQV